ncbi:iron-containing alcohol dehydrogenase [Verrucomicrobiota bacterium]
MYLDHLDKLAETAQKLDLKAPAKILFGAGKLDQLTNLTTELAGANAKCALFGGRSTAPLLERAAAQLRNAGFICETFSGISGEPTPESVDAVTAKAREIKPDLIIALGGGSVIDTAKAVAALTTNSGHIEEFLEGVGTGRTIETDPLPMIAIPTTSGTGAEMTKNAVITSYERQYKKSFRDERMIPNAVILDPELTFSAPAGVTATTGMDALTQLLESCISSRRTPATCALAYEALKKTPEALLACFNNPQDPDAHETMMLASAISGICLANSGLGLAHGIAAALGALHKVPHGIACGILLPHVIEYNATGCIDELREAFASMLGQPSATSDTVERGIDKLKNLLPALDVPVDLKHLNLSEEELRLLAEKSKGNSLNGNPIPMDSDSVYNFLQTIS